MVARRGRDALETVSLRQHVDNRRFDCSANLFTFHKKRERASEYAVRARRKVYMTSYISICYASEKKALKILLPLSQVTDARDFTWLALKARLA